MSEWRAMCGDRVVVDGWTGRVVAQHGPYSWVVIEATNSPQTHATSQLVQWSDPQAIAAERPGET